MAALKRSRGTWILILLLAGAFFLLREKRSMGAPSATLTISSPTLFSTLDNGPNDSDPTVGVFQYCGGDMVIAPGGSITCDDNGTPGSACAINMKIAGSLIIKAGGSIHADNNGNNGGNGGDITLQVGGPNFTMCGPNSSAPECGAPSVNPGAFISAQQTGGGNGTGGDIKISVGGVSLITNPGSPDAAHCDNVTICGVTFPSGTGDALVDTGAQIITNAASGRAGDLALYTGHDITINGSVLAQGFQGAGHGGAITLEACCNLVVGDSGTVSSTGRDPGPDRVHLQGCTVTIYGLVESTGPAHENASPLCTPPIRPGKALNSTACVEIWSGTTVVIDSTGTHNGQVNADTALSGGTQGHGWIDILANGDITVNDGTNDDHVQALVGGGSVPVVHIIHSNQYLGNGTGGDVQILSKNGKETFSGNAVQANDNQAGGDGGTIELQTGGVGSPAGDVLLGTASFQASGDGSSSANGGTIHGRSFQGDLSGTAPGELIATGTTPGTITLEACMGATYTGTSNPAFVLGANDGVCGGTPSFPTLPPPEAYPAANCQTFCNPITPTPTATRVQGLTPTPGICPEDPNAVLTSAVDPSGGSHGALPVFLTLQPAYDAAGNGAVIGLFGKWKENVNLGNFAGGQPKSLKITQCTSAQITAADGSLPVWLITSTGKLTIVGPDSVGGSIGWWLNNPSGGPHTLKSVRANGAGIGILIASNGNSVSWNDVSGNNLGIRVIGNNNTLKGGTTGPNTTDGVQLLGNGNTLSGASADGNGGNGVVAQGSNNQIKSNKASSNGANGFWNNAGSGNNYSGNSSNTGGKENVGAEYKFDAAGVNGGSNRADGINVPKTTIPTKCPDFAKANTVCE